MNFYLYHILFFINLIFFFISFHVFIYYCCCWYFYLFFMYYCFFLISYYLYPFIFISPCLFIYLFIYFYYQLHSYWSNLLSNFPISTDYFNYNNVQFINHIVFISVNILSNFIEISVILVLSLHFCFRIQ